MRPSLSRTTRKGCRAGRTPDPDTGGTAGPEPPRTSAAGSGRPRTVSRGSSARTVPIPTTTASLSARSRATSARAASPVIHFDVPSRAADRPSRVAAYFQVTKGRPVRWAVSHPSSGPRATSAPSTPVTTSTPAAVRATAPPPARAVGSAQAMTTRHTPAAWIAAVHGPVRPVWWHGSRVTTRVPPRARSPAAARATTSACGPPGGEVAPSPTLRPSASSTTAPTGGLGLVLPSTIRDSSTARRIAWSDRPRSGAAIRGRRRRAAARLPWRDHLRRRPLSRRRTRWRRPRRSARSSPC